MRSGLGTGARHTLNASTARAPVITAAIRETARRTPDLPAFIRDGAPVGYASLARQVGAASAWLAREGIRAGDTVGITLRDEWLNLLLSLALLHRGARQITLAPHETMAYRADLAARLATVAVIGTIPADAPGDARLLLPDAERFATEAPPDGALPAVGGEVVFFTSGTTGQPRLMTMTEAMLVSQAAALAAQGRVFHRQISYDGNHAKRVSLRSLVTGGTEVLADSLRDDGLPGIVARHGIRRVHLSPQRLDALIEEDGGRAAAAWPDGACIFTTGAKIPQAQRLRIQQALRANLFIQYGTTEFGTASIAGPDDHVLHPDAAGPLQPGVELQVLDDAGQPLPAGEAGQLRFRRPEGVVAGYLGDAAATARAFRDGWFIPGDIGRITPAGQLLVAGRQDDMMNLGGIKILPAEIEAVAEGFPGLVDCAAFAWRSAALGDLPMLAVVSAAGFDAAALLAHCRARLGLRAPRRVLELPALPRNAQGKVLRRELASLATTIAH